ncbi:MAG: ComEC/Rec2 family competence protein [Hyphomicrobium sp.]
MQAARVGGSTMADGAREGDDAAPVTAGLWTRIGASFVAERAQWFCWLPVLFGLGIGLYFSLASEPQIALALAPLGIAAALAAARPLGMPSPLGLTLLAIAAGLAAAKVRTEWTRSPVLERSYAGVEVQGHVELVEPRAVRGLRITLRPTVIGELSPDALPRRIRVRTLMVTQAPKPGDVIRMTATLAPPAAPVIPGGYDFARAAWFQGLGGVGYTLRSPVLAAGMADLPADIAFRAAIERLRQAIGARIKAVLPGETGAIATALITGERGGISGETNEAFRASGLLHILSISGLHMVVMAGAVFYVLRLLLATVPALALRYPIKSWSAVAAAVAALGYLLISGAAFATVRSYIMISIAFLAIVLGRPGIALRNIALAALIILAIWPESLLDVGFQMSFAAVTALVSAYELVNRWSRRRETAERSIFSRPFVFLGGIVLSTLVAGFAVAPFAAFHFHTSQQFAVVANLIAIPICNLIVMPAALLTLVAMPMGLEAWPLAVMGQGIEAMTWCARFAAALPGAVARIPAVPMSAFLLLVGGGLWLCLWATRWRLAGLAPIALGAALAAVPELPEILAGRDGALVAVRGPDGRLSAAGARSGSFELRRWLEHDGDGRTPSEATRAGVFRCDALGCLAQLLGETVALARHPAALDDDCAKASILVLDFPAPKGCTAPRHVLDFFKLRDSGTQAFYRRSNGDWRIETVAGVRGRRPWSAVRQRPASGAGSEPRPSHVTIKPIPVAPPADTRGIRAPPRPEVEDDDTESWFDDAPRVED